MAFSPSVLLLLSMAVSKTFGFGPVLFPCFYSNDAVSWTTSHTRTSIQTRTRSPILLLRRRMSNDNNDNDNKNDSPDLFDYFDPLLSPHAYPNGISPNQRPSNPETASSAPNPKKSSSSSSFGFRLEPESARMEVELPPPQTQQQETAVVHPDVFDPLLSPHAYPHGTPDRVVLGDATTTTTTEKVDDDRIRSSSTTTHSSLTRRRRRQRRVGILLIDHGSRNPASNDRLHHLAQVYEQEYCSNDSDTSYVVRAAHMEIAEPSIPQALHALATGSSGDDDEHHHPGVDEIICHPFFLSPSGRHVSEDIPRIVQQAQHDRKDNDRLSSIPIVVTPPVGAQTNLLLQAVHATVQASLTTTSRTTTTHQSNP